MAYNSKNPFYTTEKDDDFSFGNQSNRNNYGSSHGGSDDPFNDDEGPVDFVQIQQNSMNRQLESTQRCLASLYDSEAMGVATAEELVQQGEQLNNVEHKLDTINQDMKTTQRHLNNIKSVFGGIKNWWGGKKEAQTPEKASRESGLHKTLDESANSHDQREHPALRLREEDTRGFHDEGGAQTQAQSRSENWQQYENQLDDNLGAMSAGLSRLRGLGLGLGQEIEVQNTQIERITGKSERADVSIKDQNRQMKQILGK